MRTGQAPIPPASQTTRDRRNIARFMRITSDDGNRTFSGNHLHVTRHSPHRLVCLASRPCIQSAHLKNKTGRGRSKRIKHGP